MISKKQVSAALALIIIGITTIAFAQALIGIVSLASVSYDPTVSVTVPQFQVIKNSKGTAPTNGTLTVSNVHFNYTSIRVSLVDLGGLYTSMKALTVTFASPNSPITYAVLTLPEPSAEFLYNSTATSKGGSFTVNFIISWIAKPRVTPNINFGVTAEVVNTYGYKALTIPRDIAVNDVKPSKTIAALGYSVLVTVRVENQGDVTENCNVTAYYGAVSIGTRTLDVPSKSFRTIDFLWNTTGIPYGNYVISASALQISGEIDTVDNTYTDGTVLVTIPGDINADRAVNNLDIRLLRLALGSQPGDSRWNPNADINDDGVVDNSDMKILTSHIGQSW